LKQPSSTSISKENDNAMMMLGRRTDIEDGNYNLHDSGPNPLCKLNSVKKLYEE
jgi:hypothetical protein